MAKSNLAGRIDIVLNLVVGMQNEGISFFFCCQITAICCEMNGRTSYKPDVSVNAGARIPAAVWKFIGVFYPDGILTFFDIGSQINFKLGVAVRPCENFLSIQIDFIIHIYAFKQYGKSV